MTIFVNNIFLTAQFEVLLPPKRWVAGSILTLDENLIKGNFLSRDFLLSWDVMT